MPSSRLLSLARLGYISAGVCGVLLGCGYMYNVRYTAQLRDERLLHLAALALSGEVVKNTLNNSNVQRELGILGLNVLKDPEMGATLKRFFIRELTTDTKTREYLKKFVLQDVIRDTWVRDELTDVAKEVASSVKNDKDVYPKAVLSWLSDGVKVSVQQEEAQQMLQNSLKAALWESLSGMSLDKTL